MTAGNPKTLIGKLWLWFFTASAVAAAVTSLHASLTAQSVGELIWQTPGGRDIIPSTWVALFVLFVAVFCYDTFFSDIEGAGDRIKDGWIVIWTIIAPVLTIGMIPAVQEPYGPAILGGFCAVWAGVGFIAAYAAGWVVEGGAMLFGRR